MNSLAYRLSALTCASLALWLTSCGLAPSPLSRTTDVATDLDGAAVTGDVRLYWREAPNLVEGRCTAGLPAIRVNCQGAKRTVAETAFVTELTRTTSQAVTDANTNVTSKESARVAAQTTLASVVDLKSRQANAVAAVQTLQADIAATHTQSVGMQNQISAIEEQLLNGPSPDLAAQKQQLRTELLALQQHEAAASQQLGAQNAVVADTSTRLAALPNEATATTNRDNAVAAVTAAKAAQTAANQNQAIAADSIAKITDDVAYEVLSGNGNYPKNRPYVKQFKAVFDKLLTPPPPPPPPPAPNLNTGEGALLISTDGLLYVSLSGTLRGICDDNFDAAEAKIACRQMGRPFANPIIAGSQTGPSDTFGWDDLACVGTEQTLAQCPRSQTADDCGASEWIRLTCQ